jgi:hypothetical protein
MGGLGVALTLHLTFVVALNHSQSYFQKPDFLFSNIEVIGKKPG